MSEVTDEQRRWGAEYNALANALSAHSMLMNTEAAEAEDVRNLLRRAYRQRADLNAAIERAQKALGVE